jgi:hypothetical protein
MNFPQRKPLTDGFGDAMLGSNGRLPNGACGVRVVERDSQLFPGSFLRESDEDRRGNGKKRGDQVLSRLPGRPHRDAPPGGEARDAC